MIVTSKFSEVCKNIHSILGIDEQICVNSVRLTFEANKNARIYLNEIEHTYFSEKAVELSRSELVRGALDDLGLDGDRCYCFSVLYRRNEIVTVAIERPLTEEEDAKLAKRLKETKFVREYL